MPRKQGVIAVSISAKVTLLTSALEGAEEGLLGTEDLYSGGRVLGQVSQRSGVRDQTGTNLRNECCET